jgi:hypothetical protein
MVDVGVVDVGVVDVGVVVVGVVDVGLAGSVVVGGAGVVAVEPVVDVQLGAVLVAVEVVVPPGVEPLVSVAPDGVVAGGEPRTVGSVCVCVRPACVAVASFDGCLASGLEVAVGAVAACAGVLLPVAAVAVGLDATCFALPGVSGLMTEWRCIAGSAAPPESATPDVAGVAARGARCWAPEGDASTAAPVTSAAAASPAAALLASAPAPAETTLPADPNAAPLLAVPATAAT